MGYFDSSSDEESFSSTSTYSSGAAGRAIAAAAYKNVNPTARDSFLLPMARAGPTIGGAVKRESLIKRLFRQGHDVTTAAQEEQAPVVKKKKSKKKKKDKKKKDKKNKKKQAEEEKEQAPPPPPRTNKRVSLVTPEPDGDADVMDSSSPTANGTGGTGRRQSVFGRDTTTTKPKGTHVGRRLGSFTLEMKMSVKNLMLKVGGPDQKKGVRWSTGNSDLEPKLIETLAELYEEGLGDKIWYSPEELGAMKDEADIMAESVSMDASSKSQTSTVPTEISTTGGSSDEDEEEVEVTHEDVEDDLRGLEYRTEEGNWNAYKARQDATNAALDEQERQESQSKFTPPNLEEIAKVVQEVTTPYMMEAIQRGKRDAKVAELICLETRDEVREMEESGRISLPGGNAREGLNSSIRLRE